MPRTNTAVRPGSLPRVSSAPVTRSIVIRGTPHTALGAGGAAPTLVPSAAPQAPVVVPLAAPPPVSPEPEGSPAPGAPPAPSPAPQAKDPLAPNNSGIVPIPDSYRAGYAEHLGPRPQATSSWRHCPASRVSRGSPSSALTRATARRRPFRGHCSPRRRQASFSRQSVMPSDCGYSVPTDIGNVRTGTTKNESSVDANCDRVCDGVWSLRGRTGVRGCCRRQCGSVGHRWRRGRRHTRHRRVGRRCRQEG